MITNLHIEEFIKQAHRVGDAGLTVCSSGNLSWRLGDEALVSGTGSWVPTLQKEKVSQCVVATGEVLNGVKPSMESGFHLGVLRARPDVNVVLHFQSPYATAASCMKKKTENFNVTAEKQCRTTTPSCSPITDRWFAARISTRHSSGPCSLRWHAASSYRLVATTPCSHLRR